MMVLGMSAQAFSAPLPEEVGQVGQVVVGGTGCADATITRISNGRIRVETDKLAAEVGGDSGRSMDLKSCTIAIPVQVNAGYQVANADLTLSGRVRLAEGSAADARVESFFAGARGPVKVREYTGATRRRTIITTNYPDDQKIWSACGQDVILRVNTRIKAELGTATDAGSLALERATVAPIEWRRCE